MHVLSIGRDKDGHIFNPESAVAQRNIAYGKKLGSVSIIIFALKSQNFTETRLSDEVTVYPTQSSSRWFFIRDAIRLGKKIITGETPTPVGSGSRPQASAFVRGDSVITCQDPFETGFVAWHIADSFHLPLHIQIHTDFLSSYFKTSFLQRLRVVYAKSLLPKAVGMRVVSERIAKSILQAGIPIRHSPQILPIRINSELIEKAQKIDLHAQFPQFKFIVLMASRLSKEKRINDALTSFSKVVAQYPFAGLLIAGDGSEKEILMKKAAVLGIANHVVFLGFRNDIPSLMKSSNLFLSTSEFEGYGMSLMEAGLSYCPIVTTDVGIAGSILKDGVNACICAVGSVDCFYGKIIMLMSDNAMKEIFTGRLYSDIRASIPTPEEYVEQYAQGIEEIKGNI